MRVFAIFLCFLLLSSCNRPLGPQRSFQVASGSMAPTLWGPRYPTHCTNCGKQSWILADAFDPNLPISCSCCGDAIAWDDQLIPGDTVKVEPISPSASPRRLDIVVVEAGNAPDSNFPCVKRIWGMPGERIELRKGDAWINGNRYQKSLHELLKVCVPISRYPEDAHSRWYFQNENSRSNSGDQSTLAVESVAPPPLRLTPGQCIQFRYQQLQRVEGKLQLVESPINDDCSFNQNSPIAIHPVDDYLVRIEFGDISATRLWSIHHDTLRRSLSLNCIERLTDSQMHLIRCQDWLIVGLCDGRLLATSDIEVHSWEMESSSVEPARPHHSQITNQSNTDLIMTQLFVARDLWLGSHQPRRDVWVPMTEETDGYFLLGDNLAISNDSRSNDFGRIDRRRISGIVVSEVPAPF